MEPSGTSDPQSGRSSNDKPDLADTGIDLVVGPTVELARHACDVYGIDPHRAFNIKNAIQRLNGTRDVKVLMVTTPQDPVPIEWGRLHAAVRRAHARVAVVVLPPPAP